MPSNAGHQAARLSIAPMMDWTDRHCRVLHRLLAPNALLYTEMVHSAAVVRGDTARLLDNGEVTGAVALQLGGCDPTEMAAAARLGEEFGYTEININVGCPSDRVQSGRFGACLMAQPEVVAECVDRMRAAVRIPVTVKTRIGIDEHDSDAFFSRFIDVVASAGCTTFVVHARIAILAGLSPKENREVPPLNYPRVYRLKQRCPDLTVVINGGVRDVPSMCAHLQHVDGVMIGREAYRNPYALTALSRALDPGHVALSRPDVLAHYADYARRQVEAGVPLRAIARHTLGLFQGQPGGRRFRRVLGERMHTDAGDVDILWQALAATHLFPGDDARR